MKNFRKYFPISSLEEKWGLYLTTTGCNKIEPGCAEIYPATREHPSNYTFTWKTGRTLKEYQLVYITSGAGVFEATNVPLQTVHEGSCFLLYPGMWHRYKPNDSSGWTEYWIGFKGYYPDSFMKQGFFSEQRPVIELGADEEILLLFHKLFATVQQGQLGYPQVLSSVLLEILARMHGHAHYGHRHNDPENSLVQKAKFLMREAIEESLNIEDIVRELPVSYSKFRKLFKQVTGESPNQYYLNLRLKKALHLLDATQLPVSEIAYQSGFDSVFYFSRLFKKKHGHSPKAHREQGQNQRKIMALS